MSSGAFLRLTAYDIGECDDIPGSFPHSNKAHGPDDNDTAVKDGEEAVLKRPQEAGQDDKTQKSSGANREIQHDDTDDSNGKRIDALFYSQVKDVKDDHNIIGLLKNSAWEEDHKTDSGDVVDHATPSGNTAFEATRPHSVNTGNQQNRSYPTIHIPRVVEDNISVKEQVSPVATIFKKPLVLIAEPHGAFTPEIVDISALSDNNSVDATFYRPVFRRLGSCRPPPSSPPEPLSPEQLSMPTLPTLHLTSIPALIEQYRAERRLNPAGFDEQTKGVKEALVQAKIERGGSSVLLNNEFTAELASRLDAEAIERMSVVRCHDEPYYTDSDSDEADQSINLQRPDTPTHTEPAPSADAHPKVIDYETSFEEPVSLEYLRFARHARKHATSGHVTTKSHIRKEANDNGTERHIHETYIKITEVVSKVDKTALKEDARVKDDASVDADKDESKSADVDNKDGKEGTISDIIDSLVQIRGEKGEKLIKEVMEMIEKAKK